MHQTYTKTRDLYRVHPICDSHVFMARANFKQRCRERYICFI